MNTESNIPLYFALSVLVLLSILLFLSIAHLIIQYRRDSKRIRTKSVEMNNDKAWLKQMAANEKYECISASGMHATPFAKNGQNP